MYITIIDVLLKVNIVCAEFSNFELNVEGR